LRLGGNAHLLLKEGKEKGVKDGAKTKCLKWLLVGGTTKRNKRGLLLAIKKIKT